MTPDFHYETVSEALNELRKKGYTTDFNLKENHLYCNAGKFHAGDFTIDEVYRYEGNSDPADEATVYAISSVSGVKGVLVTGFGASADQNSSDLLKLLKVSPGRKS
jgi:hypothetical protein